MDIQRKEKTIKILPEGTLVLISKITSPDAPVQKSSAIFLGIAENGEVTIPKHTLSPFEGYLYRFRHKDCVPIEVNWVRKLPKGVRLEAIDWDALCPKPIGNIKFTNLMKFFHTIFTMGQ